MLANRVCGGEVLSAGAVGAPSDGGREHEARLAPLASLLRRLGRVPVEPWALSRMEAARGSVGVSRDGSRIR